MRYFAFPEYCILFILMVYSIAWGDSVQLRNGSIYNYKITKVNSAYITFDNGQSTVYKLISEITCSDANIVEQLRTIYPEIIVTPENGSYKLDFSNVVPEYVEPEKHYLLDFVDLSLNKVFMKNDYNKIQLIFKPKDLNILLNFTINDITTNSKGDDNTSIFGQSLVNSDDQTTIYGPSMGIGYYLNSYWAGYVVYTSKALLMQNRATDDVPGDFWTFRFEFSAPVFNNVFGIKMGYEYNTPEKHSREISQNGIFLGLGIHYNLNSLY